MMLSLVDHPSKSSCTYCNKGTIIWWQYTPCRSNTSSVSCYVDEDNSAEWGRKMQENDEYEVDLRDYLHVLWEGKWIIIFTFLVAVATALAVSYSAPKQYQTRTSLLLLPPLSTEVGGEVTGTVFSPETYKRLALTGDLLQDVVTQVYPKGGGTTVDSLRSHIKIDVEQTAAKDFPGRFPLYLTMTVSGTDPEKLPLLAQAWAQKFTERNSQLFLSRTAQSYDYIKQSFDEVERSLLAKENDLTLYQQKNPEPVMQATVAALQDEYTSYLQQLPDKMLQLTNQQARLSALKEALSTQSEHFTVKRGLSSEALWNFLAAGVSAQKIDSLPSLSIQDQVLNDTYVSLQQAVSDAEATVKGLQASVEYLQSKAEQTRKAFEEKQGQLVAIQAQLDKMNRDIKVLDDTYTSLSNKLQQAKIAQVETPAPIRTVEAPLLPSHSIAPNKKMNVAVAGVLGLFLGVLLAFFAHYLQSGKDAHEEALQPLHGEDSNEVSDKATPDDKGDLH